MSVALVLGAGGVVGQAWHAGVLSALADELGWDARQADHVIGTSAGSVAGALLRAGIGPGDLFGRATGEPLSAEAQSRLSAAGMRQPPTLPSPTLGRSRMPASPALFARAAMTFRPGLLLAGALPRGTTDNSVIANGVAALFPDGWPDARLEVCAVRLDDGRRTVFGRPGSPSAGVGEAVAASCAIPGYFKTVRIDGVEYVDGGVHSPTNADLARGADLVLVSSPMSLDSAALRRPATDRVFRMGHRASLERELVPLRRSGTPVVTFQPGVEDLAVMGGTAGAMDTGRREVVARQAKATTTRRLRSPELRSVLGAAGVA
jgi:NTE family protein